MINKNLLAQLEDSVKQIKDGIEKNAWLMLMRLTSDSMMNIHRFQ